MNGMLLHSIGCLGSRITSKLFTLKFKHLGTKCYLALGGVAIESCSYANKVHLPF